MTQQDTSIVNRWKDCTSYSRDDKERVPTSYAAEHGTLRVVITCGHIYYPGKWVLHCRALSIDTMQIPATDLSSAQSIALSIVDKRIADMKHNLDQICEEA